MSLEEDPKLQMKIQLADTSDTSILALWDPDPGNLLQSNRKRIWSPLSNVCHLKCIDWFVHSEGD